MAKYGNQAVFHVKQHLRRSLSTKKEHCLTKVPEIQKVRTNLNGVTSTISSRITVANADDMRLNNSSREACKNLVSFSILSPVAKQKTQTLEICEPVLAKVVRTFIRTGQNISVTSRDVFPRRGSITHLK